MYNLAQSDGYHYKFVAWPSELAEERQAVSAYVSQEVDSKLANSAVESSEPGFVATTIAEICDNALKVTEIKLEGDVDASGIAEAMANCPNLEKVSLRECNLVMRQARPS